MSGLPISPEEMYGPWPVAGYSVRIDFSEGVRLRAERNGEACKALPPAVRHSGDMAWIRLALDAARGHWRDLRALLENGMVERIPLSAEDLALLALDPVGRVQLGGVLVELDGVVGRPVPEEWRLETLSGDLARLAGPVRVVHPLSLSRAGTLERWDAWYGRHWFRQPFKQIRRELYRPGVDDLADGTYSSRVAGVVVRWDQARAVLEGRGWTRVTKTGAARLYRRSRLTAHLEFRTPETRGFSREDVMLHRVYFLPPAEQSPSRASPGIPVQEVDPILFSEALRDATLVSHAATRRESGNQG
jgi:hypothetical protein